MSPGSAAVVQTRDDAISEVLGGAILVAIAVALAVAVFFMVNLINKPKEAPANFGMQYDENLDAVQFIRSTRTYDLSEVQVQMPVAGHFSYGGQAGSASPAMPAGQPVPLSSTPGTSLQPGDRITFCTDVASTGVLVQFTHPASGTLLANHRFDSIGACT